MAKILNLDSLASGEKRYLKLDGKDYLVEEMTVENFIETTKMAEKLANEASMAKQVEATVDMIVRSIPSVEKKVLMKRPLEQLKVIAAFARGDDVDGQEKTEENAEGK